MSEIILITGAAGGIGQCLCRQLIQRDVKLILVDLDAARLESLCASLGERATPYALDLTDEQQICDLIAFVGERFGRLDGLINNAGIVLVDPFATRSSASIRRELDINLLAPLLLTRHAIGLLEASNNARVVSTVSIAGIFPTAESPIYSASKFGLRGAMLSLALELEPRGIRIACVLPSATDTPMLRQEAIAGGNALQFMDPPQSPEVVATCIVKALDKPGMERAPRASELWVCKLAMLFPNLLPRLLPILQKRGERGMQRYLEGLETRGLVERQDGKWKIVG
ncbi:SDR family oxidoreductase [Ectopseudomonas composti]